jgi:iron complex outermembrane receptor protein
LFSPQLARAQTAPTNADIIVSGIRQSLANALNTKRNSDQVVDAISAEDVGKFPDKNVGEALQRITGVQIQRAGGEGSAVSIRGVDPD